MGVIDPHTHHVVEFMGTKAIDDFFSGHAAVSTLSTYKGSLMIKDDLLIEGLKRCKPLGALAMVHAENGDARAMLYQDLQWYVTNPPMRAPEHHKALQAALSAGILQVVATDHCAFNSTQKALGIDDFRKIRNGVNGAVVAGSDADIIILNPNATVEISTRSHHSRTDTNIYEGRRGKGCSQNILPRLFLLSIWKEDTVDEMRAIVDS
ncbi:hypothetical protein Tsubulata_021407 [Turnera subulata]|uniref:Amidohydrolase-related domain-containing protein n=1 Tax=Turnera subulata TaxID=218843 RepID=A0A9Q0G627_9ROSI|nr:hypothetical protein Tsubulata_021407 [Turnera subulata]